MKNTGERIIYLDTSALVKLVIQEEESARLNDDLRSRDRKIVSEWCLTELASVLMKRVRSKSLESKKAREAYDRIWSDAEVGVFELVDMTPEIHRAAERLILDRGASINLGAADALHLAAAEHHQATVLMTFDRAQAAAARATGRIEVRDSV